MNAAANMPVMVFIHGGAFMYGQGNAYDPINIMDWDMVVVTLNYRLGPLGKHVLYIVTWLPPQGPGQTPNTGLTSWKDTEDRANKKK